MLEHNKSFLDIIVQIVNWKYIIKLLNYKLQKSQNKAGNKSYPPIKMLKILLLQFLYNLSDREVSESIFDRISFRKFTGFTSNLTTPSYSTICRFRNKLIENNLLEEIFNFINSNLESNYLISKKTVIVDASIITSARKAKRVIDLSESADNKIIYSDDVDAKWTIKTGKFFYGYKLHMSTDSKCGFILGGHVTSANYSDTKELLSVIQESNLRKGSLILADKGYASNENRTTLRTLGLQDGIMHKKKSGKVLSEVKKFINSKISSVRGIVERAFGTLKQKHGFNRAKYLGLAKIKGQFLLSAIAFNLKKASSFVN